MKTIDFIRTKQTEWFQKIRSFLGQKNLNVGSGLGYFSQCANKAGVSMTSLEVHLAPGVVNRDEVILYDGTKMPFADASFDTASAMYVLHHTPNPLAILDEMGRVSPKRIILVEELYTSFFGKIRLALLDFWINFRAHQKSEIYWNSYFSKKEFRKVLEQKGWHITHYSANPDVGFEEVLCVADKDTV